MKNIHLLPTDKPSKLQKTKHDNFFLSFRVDLFTDCTSQHIYITSDEEIKEGDWFINTFNDNQPKLQKRYGDWITCYNQHKIILTTDPDLIADGVQAIDDEFLEWFVNNPSCEWVKVEPREFLADKVIYEIIIPQEEKPSLATKLKTVLDNMSQEEFDSEWKKVVDLNIESPSFVENESKQETLEEAAERLIINPTLEDKQVFESGAKWQSERMYTLEHMRLCWAEAFHVGFNFSPADSNHPTFKDFIEKLYDTKQP